MLAVLLALFALQVRAPSNLAVFIADGPPAGLGVHLSGRFSYHALDGSWPDEYWHLPLVCADNAPWSASPPYTGEIYTVVRNGLEQPGGAFQVVIGNTTGLVRLTGGPCDVRILPVCAGGVHPCSLQWPATDDIRVTWVWLSGADIDTLRCPASSYVWPGVPVCQAVGVGVPVSCSSCTCQAGQVVSCP